MNKKYLKDGMIVRLRNNICYCILHNDILIKDEDEGRYEIITSLNKYNDDMKSDEDEILDIMKVYDSNMKILWKRKEIDWSKIPCDTKVFVTNTNTENDKEWVKRYFESYNPKDKYPFYTYIAGLTSWSAEGEHGKWKYCKLAEGEYERLQDEGILL